MTIIKVHTKKFGNKVLKETFGILKGKVRKRGKQKKDELRKELYNDYFFTENKM